MSERIFIGIDAGTSQIKCVAFSATGKQIASASRNNEYNSPADDQVVQDAITTRRLMLSTLTELIAGLGKHAQQVVGMAITAMGDGLLLVDKHGEPIHEGWLWLDSRSADVVAEFESGQNYQTVFNTTGTAINASQMRSQMLWLDKHQPALLDAAEHAFHWKDYLYFCLTGARVTDPSEALFTFGSFKSAQYDNDVISALGLQHRAALLPPIVDGMNESHALLNDIAKEIGLDHSVPVTLGYVDVICSALGGGLYNQGATSAMTIMGTTGIHMRYAGSGAQIQLPRQATGYTIAFPGGGFVQLQTNMAATLNIDWIMNIGVEILTAHGHNASIDDMLLSLDEHMKNAPLNGVLYHPYISNAGERGPFFDTHARASFDGLDQNSGYYDLVRSVIEGMCFAARDCYQSLGDIPAEIRLTGGAAKSKVIQSILANVLNRPVRVAEMQESGAAGAVMMATVAHGVFATLDDCCQTWLDSKLGDAVLPDVSIAAHYDKLFETYVAARDDRMSNGIWAQLAEIRKQIGSAKAQS